MADEEYRSFRFTDPQKPIDWGRLTHPSNQLSDEVRSAALDIRERENGHLEEMCERAITSAVPVGVIVVDESDVMEGDFDTGFSLTTIRRYALDPNVPYGHIYRFPSMEAYRLWYARGCPTG